MVRRLILWTLFVTGFAIHASAQDMTSAPPLPKPLEQQKMAGAQVYYLGKYDTLDGWAVIRTGQPEFYYATPGNQALVMGLLFNAEGDIQTTEQLRQLQESQRATITGIMNAPTPAPIPVPPIATPGQVANPLANPVQSDSSPAAKLLADVQSGSSILLGSSLAPTFYAFIDPNCPHCQQFLKEVEPAVIAGQVAVRILPVGFDDPSKKQAAFLLASADGGQKMLAYAKGDEKAIPVPGDINVASVENNVSLLSQWHLMATPIILYRAAATNEIKLIRGRPLDINAAIADLRGPAGK